MLRIEMDTAGYDGQVIVEFVGYCDEGEDGVDCTRDVDGYAIDNALCHAPVGSEDLFYLDRYLCVEKEHVNGTLIFELYRSCHYE